MIPGPALAADLISHEMIELGAHGVTVEERLLDTFVMPDFDKDTPESLHLKAYFANVEDIESLRRKVLRRLQELRGLLPELPRIAIEVRTVCEQDWAEDWKQHFGTTRIGRRLVITPTWEAFNGGAEDAVVTLDPGMAFGTGTHDTTRLCLEALAQTFEVRPPVSVLDVGTGSGILAIAAAALGAEKVTACDIEPQSCRIAAENARLNRVADRVHVTGTKLEDLEGSFEMVLANILAEENIRLAPQLLSRLACGGSLILSGILREKESLVTAAFATYGLGEPSVLRTPDWSCLIYRPTD